MRRAARLAGLLAVTLVVALAVASCSGDDDGNENAAPASDAAAVRFVSQNILHGTACAPDSNRCSLPERIDLFVQQLAAADCPEMVGLQEANQFVVDELTPELANICDGRYEVVRDDDAGNDREVVLSTLPVLGSRRERLAGPLRTAFWVRAASDIGVIDFVTTHLASGSDDRPCDARMCPPPCAPSDSLQLCQARDVAALVDALALPESVVVVGGDLNATATEPTTQVFADRGWLDTHLAAGNPECDPATGAQCTSGREDASLDDLTDPQSKQSERIDYLWLAGERDCTVVPPTGLFNAEPAENGPAGLAFPSDHTGVEATIECPTDQAQRDAATGVTLPPTTTTTTPDRPDADAATTEAITEAFNTVFSGRITDPEQRLAGLQDADELREFFLETYESTKEIAARISVRMDSVTLTDPDQAEVVYSLLLDGAPVLDHLPGQAVRENGRWLVARQTFCDVSTQGAEELPPACQ
jgi:endonuclease/exonuclease/phosphatase family metal-dependent hydrolase